MSFESAITFFFVVFIFGITPGPGIFATLARALVSGAWSCFPLVLGMVISDIVYLILACFGLAVIAEQWGEIFTVIRIVGAAYLLYLGWKMWNAPVDLDQNAQKFSGQWHLALLQGFLISASNPKVILFYVAFLPTFMDLSALTTADVILASGLTFVALMIGVMMIAFGAAAAKRFFKSERAVKRLNRSAGSLMMGAGVYLAGRG